MKNLLNALCALTIVATFAACESNSIDIRSPEIIGYSEAEYAELSEVLELPRYVDDYRGAPTFKLATQATLGRVLFYDKQLSEDYSVSCASCHVQENAFADPEALSEGIYGRRTDRNSIALGSFASFSSEYGSGNGGVSSFRSLFWDQRAHSVHSQMVETIANDKEMGMSMTDIVNRINGQRHYEILFDKAFLSPQITTDGILVALSSYMQAMTADNSRFDQNKIGISNSLSQVLNDFNGFTSSENQGKALFVENCMTCHARSLVSFVSSSIESASNGLELESVDPGVGGHTGDPYDVGLFKVPMLRNVALTAPYMHDGRFASLEDVLDFYSTGIQAHPNLHPALIDENTGTPKRMNFSQDDKDALLAFLNTLTDMSELSTQKFADPWLE